MCLVSSHYFPSTIHPPRFPPFSDKLFNFFSAYFVNASINKTVSVGLKGMRMVDSPLPEPYQRVYFLLAWVASCWLMFLASWFLATYWVVFDRY